MSVAALATASTVFATGAPAGARSAAPKFTVTTFPNAAFPSEVTRGPESNIKSIAPHGRPKFKPHALTIAPKTGRRCTGTRRGATVVNHTDRTQTITYHDKPVSTLTPRAVALFCAGGPAVFVFGLVNSTSTLTVTFT